MKKRTRARTTTRRESLSSWNGNPVVGAGGFTCDGQCVWNGSVLHVGAGARERRHGPVLQLVRLHHVFVLSHIRVLVHAGHDTVRVLVRRVRRHRVRQPGPHVDGRTDVHLFRGHDSHQERVVLAQTSNPRHGHPSTDPSSSTTLVRIACDGLLVTPIFVFQDIQSQHVRLTDAQQQYSLPIRTVSEITLPPPYEQLVANINGEGSDLPPPSYEEAIVSVSKEAAKSNNVIVHKYSVKWFGENKRYISIINENFTQRNRSCL